VPLPNNESAVWDMHSFPMGTPVEWSTFCMQLKGKHILSSTLDLVKSEWEERSLKMGEHFTEFDECFHCLSVELDPHHPMPAEMLVDPYGNEVKNGNQRGCR